MKILRIIIILLSLFCLQFCICRFTSINPELNPTNKYIKAGTDLDRIKKLISKGEDMNELDEGRAPLHAIVKSITCLRFESCRLTINEYDAHGEYGNKKIRNERMDKYYKVAELLLDSGADVNVRDGYGNTPVQYCEDVRCAKLFLKYILSINMSLPPYKYSSFANPELIKLLITNIADINARDSEGETLLFSCRDKETAEMSIRNGADVKVRNIKGETPLFYCENRKVAELLIKNGADVNVRNLKGETPLFSSRGSDDVIELMIKKGADVNVKNFEGKTALFYVERPERVRLFVKYKIVVNEQDNDGRTALHFILSKNNLSNSYLPDILETILELLDSGAKVDINDRKGITPLDIATDIVNKNENPSGMFGKKFYDTILKYKK